MDVVAIPEGKYHCSGGCTRYYFRFLFLFDLNLPCILKKNTNNLLKVMNKYWLMQGALVVVLNVISQQLLNELPLKLAHTFMVPWGANSHRSHTSKANDIPTGFCLTWCLCASLDSTATLTLIFLPWHQPVCLLMLIHAWTWPTQATN